MDIIFSCLMKFSSVLLSPQWQVHITFRFTVIITCEFYVVYVSVTYQMLLIYNRLC